MVEKVQRFRVDFLESALTDIQAIYLYILDKSESASVAAGFADRIVDRAERIGDAPLGGVLRPDLGKDLRLVPFERSAVIVYRFAGDVVEIINVFYGGRDYAALMRDGANRNDI